MGSIIGQKIDYNGVGALRGQRHIPSKHKPKYPPPAPRDVEGSSVLEKSPLARVEDAGVLVSGDPTPPQQNVKEIYLVVLPLQVEFKQN